MDYYLSEGLEGVERQKYRGTREFTYAIESKLTELGLGDWKGGQYLVFTSVTQGEFTELDRYRDRYHKSLRLHVPRGERGIDSQGQSWRN